MIELKDTIPMMTSPDYKERFKAEYYQLKIRLEKLSAMLDKYVAGVLDFTPSCPFYIFQDQEANMKRYLRILENRAKIEKIDL